MSNCFSPLLVSRIEAARLLAISPRKLDELKAGQQIPFVRIGKSIRFDPADLRAWIAEQKIPVRAS